MNIGRIFFRKNITDLPTILEVQQYGKSVNVYLCVKNVQPSKCSRKLRQKKIYYTVDNVVLLATKETKETNHVNAARSFCDPIDFE